MTVWKYGLAVALAAVMTGVGGVAAAERGGPATGDRDISKRGYGGAYTGNAGAGTGTGSETSTVTDSAGTNERGLTAGSGSDTGTTETSRGTATGVVGPGTGTQATGASDGGALEQD